MIRLPPPSAREREFAQHQVCLVQRIAATFRLSLYRCIGHRLR